MDTQRFQRLSELFESVRQAPPAEREARLQAACGVDDELLAEVRKLIRHHESASGGLDQPPAMPASVAESLRGDSDFATAPQRIGRYRVIRKVGEGGMGVVYEAEQDNPRRTVALKILNAALTGPKALRRFEHEAQILGRLHHPGIAQIFEAGTFDVTPGATRPFFAMEFVRGEPITRFAQQHHLGPRERLELVARVADAVQHAHSKGVIHRDLKPGNILVQRTATSRTAGESSSAAEPRPSTPVAEDIVPKILDFGVARATDADLAITTLKTDIGQLIGTLPYMSPEQAAGNPDELDTRSDVYALGVIAYELLAGRLPYDLSRKLAAEAARIIRDEEPTRLSAINRTFRGDIETIVAKALEKDKDRRYQSASELGDDIRRYLRDEAVIARPPSATYLIRKFAQRNRGLVAAAVAVFVVLVAGVVATTLAMLRAQASESTAQSNLTLAQSQQSRAEQAERTALDRLAIAEREAAKSDAVSAFITDMLVAVDPRLTPDREITMRQVLDQAAQTVDDGALREQPEVEAAVRQAVAQTYFQLGEYDAARRHIERAIELFKSVHAGDHMDTAEAMTTLAEIDREARRYSQALGVAREALAMKRRLAGDRDSEQLATSISNVALCIKQGGAGGPDGMAECESLNREALAMFRRIHGGKPHDDLSMSLNNLAMTIWSSRRDLDEVEKLLREALEIQRQLRDVPHPFLANALQNMADLMKARGDQHEAARMLREAVDVHTKVLGPDHERVAETMNNLAIIEKNLGNYEAAEPLYTRSIEIRRKFWGDRHQTVAEGLGNFGVYLMTVGRLDEAEQAMKEAVSIRSEGRGPDHNLTLIAKTNLAQLYMRQEKFDQAEAIYDELLPLRRANPGQASIDLSIHLANHGNFLHERGRGAQGEPLLREALEIRIAASGDDHPDTANVLNNLAQCVRGQGRLDEALSLHHRALEIRTSRLGPDHPHTALSQSNIAAVLAEQGDLDSALDLARHSLATRRAKLPAAHAEITAGMGQVGSLLVKRGGGDALAEAESLLRQAHERRSATLPAGHWRLGESAGALGDCLAALKRLDEAEPLLLQRANAMVASPMRLESKRREAVQAMVDLYEQLEKPESATLWRDELDKSGDRQP